MHSIGDLFDAIDANNDGLIDKDEWKQFNIQGQSMLDEAFAKESQEQHNFEPDPTADLRSPGGRRPGQKADDRLERARVDYAQKEAEVQHRTPYQYPVGVGHSESSCPQTPEVGTKLAGVGQGSAEGMYLSDSMEDSPESLHEQQQCARANCTPATAFRTPLTHQHLASGEQDIDLSALHQTLQDAQKEEEAAMEKVHAARKLREDTANMIRQLTPRQKSKEEPQPEPKVVPRELPKKPEAAVQTAPLTEVLQQSHKEFQRLDLDNSGVLEAADVIWMGNWVCTRLVGSQSNWMSDKQVEMIETELDERDGLMDFAEFSEQMQRLFGERATEQRVGAPVRELPVRLGSNAAWVHESPGGMAEAAEAAMQRLDALQTPEVVQVGATPEPRGEKTAAEWAAWIMMKSDRHQRNGLLTVNELQTFLPQHPFTSWITAERGRLIRWLLCCCASRCATLCLARCLSL